jgi:hypothetical protein
MAFQIPYGTLRQNIAPLEVYMQSRGYQVRLPVDAPVDQLVLNINDALEAASVPVGLRDIVGQTDADLELSLNRVLLELG